MPPRPFSPAVALHDPFDPSTSPDVIIPGRTFVITYVNSEEDVGEWLEDHTRGPCVLGLDAEWRPVFVAGAKPTLGTIQLSTATHAIVIQFSALVRSPRGVGTHQNCLQRLLSRTDVTFVGMGVKEDLRLLQMSVVGNVNPRSRFVELKSYGAAAGVVVPGGLLGLAQEVLVGIAKWKSKRLQMSNWTASPLTWDRVVYAAMDAWVGRAVWAGLGGE